MGGSNSRIKETFELDNYMKDAESTQKLIALAFNKCVVAPEGSSHEFNHHELNEEQRRCIHEYVALYSQYARPAYKKFSDLYNAHNEAMMRQQQEMMGGGGGGGPGGPG